MTAKVARLEELEIQVQQQQSMINALQQEKEIQTLINSKSSPNINSVNEQIPDLKSVATTGMPKSCADLRYIGHTVNGLYLILGTEQIETVFCDFTQLPSDPSI